MFGLSRLDNGPELSMFEKGREDSFLLVEIWRTRIEAGGF
jgi:hypothetical protein